MKATLLFLALLTIPILLFQPVSQASATVPVQTDDGLDPVNLIFTGSAPASWVAQNFKGWNSNLCSEPQKALNGRTYDFNLETPDTRNQAPPCWGPRYHVRIWDMGTDPVLGQWSIGAGHYEHTECSFFIFCHHVIDSWEQAEALVRSTFTNGTVALSISNYSLNNSRLYQGVYNDGSATMIRLSPTNLYSLTFSEVGLPAHTPWSVTLNGTSSFSTDESIGVRMPTGAYSFTVGEVSGYRANVSSGSFTLTGNRVISLRFVSTQALESVASQPSVEFFLVATIITLSMVVATSVFKRVRGRKKSTELGV